MSFNRAIVKLPCRKITQALSTSNLGKPDFFKALEQHSHYVGALQQCGLEVITLEADNLYPDSTFVEDTALLTPRCAVISRPGAPTRRGEVADIEEVVGRYYHSIEYIQAPGTVDAGDILRVDSQYYMGLSSRTNPEGARQMIAILEKYGMYGLTVSLRDMLHLKSGIAYLENDYLITAGEFIDHPAFRKFKQIKVDPTESYAANCLWLNGNVLVAQGYPNISRAIKQAGFPVIEIDTSEFRKIDGGLSCLSLRF